MHTTDRRSFLSSEAGSVTVDWLVLTAMVVGLTLLVGGAIGFVTLNQTSLYTTQVEVWKGDAEAPEGYRPANAAAFSHIESILSGLTEDQLSEVSRYAASPKASGNGGRDLDMAVNKEYQERGKDRPRGTAYNPGTVSDVEADTGLVSASDY